MISFLVAIVTKMYANGMAGKIFRYVLKRHLLRDFLKIKLIIFMHIFNNTIFILNLFQRLDYR